MKNEIKNWRWNIPEGKTTISPKDAETIIENYNSFKNSTLDKIDNIVREEEEKRLEELYRDLCEDLKVNPESSKVKELYKRAKLKYPHIIRFIVDQFKNDIELFVKDGMV